MATADFQVVGRNPKALFTLRIHRGEGMALLAMNWKQGRPPAEFVGFEITYKPPGADRFFVLPNRLSFLTADGRVVRSSRPTTVSPIQKFRWVHFPRNPELLGEFLYRVVPVFMNDTGELSYGEPQDAGLELRRETYPGQLNVTFTRGMVSSQAFVDRYGAADDVSSLLPGDAVDGLRFKPTHANADEALGWMGFEARQAILDVLDEAIADKKAKVLVVAYDLNEPEIVTRLEKLKRRLRVIIDDDPKSHGEPGSAENQAQTRLEASAGAANVKRQHMDKIQHNKTIVVDGPNVRAVVCGSTNFSWRGFYVQANNAVVVRGEAAVAAFRAAFESYWVNNTAATFGVTPPTQFTDLGFKEIDARVAFSPHAKSNALLATIAEDIEEHTTSTLFFSLAFLYQTKGPIRDAIEAVTAGAAFVYGMSDRTVGGLDVQKPNGNLAVVRPSALGRGVPEPFKSEPKAGSGNRMHHKFVVIDFDKPSARVYLGSYNFSGPADTANGENLVLVRDRRIAVAYTVEALRLFDHYHFRVTQEEAKKAKRPLVLTTAPRRPGDAPWWDAYYQDATKIRDRKLFA
jgi:phosphatidylserine/phosphatidylglycerophosphate/cardiolipin synthase-like enzyme